MVCLMQILGICQQNFAHKVSLPLLLGHKSMDAHHLMSKKHHHLLKLKKTVTLHIQMSAYPLLPQTWIVEKECVYVEERGRVSVCAREREREIKVFLAFQE